MNNKKNIKIKATVVKAGDCRYYKEGNNFEIGGFTPAGICNSAFLAIIRDAQAMRYGAKLPWEKDGKVLTHCPDPEGAVWELERIEK